MRILCLGDSPFIKTGFGVVNDVATKHLIAQGHAVYVLGGQDTEARSPDDFTFYPTAGINADMLGWALVEDAIRQSKPDAIHIIGDPATVTAWLIHPALADIPIVAYMPVEGAPMNMRWTETFRRNVHHVDFITCSEYGQRVLSDAGFDSWMAYHGVSPDFSQGENEYRDMMRDAVGWTDKFVVMSVAQNVRRKSWPRLFEGIRLAARKFPDIYLYAHTVPFNNFWLGGHDLPQLAEQMGVSDRVIFPATYVKHNDFVALRGETAPGLIDLYNMADAFFLPSQVEGFGLPLAEAMACGAPVVTTDYAAQAEVVGNAGYLLPVADWEWNQSHTKYANVDPHDIADAIVRLRRSPELRRQMSRKSLERAKTFTWDAYRQTLTERFDAINVSLQEHSQAAA